MAKIVEFDRFKVIKASAKELFDAVGSPGSGDDCSERPGRGYYRAVLNKWYCPKCWKEYKNGAFWDPEDGQREERNFKHSAFCRGINVEQ